MDNDLRALTCFTFLLAVLSLAIVHFYLATTIATKDPVRESSQPLSCESTQATGISSPETGSHDMLTELRRLQAQVAMLELRHAEAALQQAHHALRAAMQKVTQRHKALDAARSHEDLAVNKYAQQTAQQTPLTQTLVAKLPREIRDIVYGHLWTDDFDRMRLALQRHAYGLLEWRDEDVLAPAPNFVTTPYCNDTATTEILSYLYEASYRVGEHTVRLNNLRHFLTADPFRRGITPTQFVRKVHVIWTYCPEKKTRNTLAMLAGIEFPNTVSIRITKAADQPSDGMKARYEATVEALRRKGHNVTVVTVTPHA